MTENSTNTVPKIYDALNKAQHNMTKAKKDANNPHFKSSYATLAAVHDAVMPALLGEGFAVMQAITPDGNGVETRLQLGSESISTVVPFVGAPKTAQQLGSEITYARRYGLMMLCGIATEDDDGNAAAVAPAKEGPKSEAQPTKAKPDFKKLFARIKSCDSDDDLIKAERWIAENADTSAEALLKAVHERRDEILSLNSLGDDDEIS